MKQIVFSVMLMFAALTATAQDQKSEGFNQKFFDAKVSELVYRLDMTDEQKAKFEPIYRRYHEEMRSVMGPRMKKIGDRKKGENKAGEKKDGEVKQKKQPLTEEEKLARTKQRMERQKKAQDIRLKYMDEFSKVLTAKQMNKFYEVESKMQKKMKNRRLNPKNNKNGKKRPNKQKKD